MLPAPSPARRYVVWGLLAVVAVVAVGGWWLLRPGFELEAAEAALRRNDPLKARYHFGRYLAWSPGDKKSLLPAATAARRSGAYADAEKLLTEFEKAVGTTAASRLEWVLIGTEQGDFAGVETRLLADAGKPHPDAVPLLEALAKGYDAAFRYPDAVECLNRLLQLEPTNVPALTLHGVLTARLRQIEPAEKNLRKAVELAPTDAPARTALADLLNRRGHTREAVVQYEQSLRLRPADPATLLGLARALTFAALPDEATKRLDELLAHHPDHPDALVERGRIALRQGRAEAAATDLLRATGVAPWHRDGHRLLLAALKELGRTAEAAKCEARVAELDTEDGTGGRLKIRARDSAKDVAVRLELWDWSLRNGAEAEGVAWLTEILRLDPDHGPANAALADHFDRLGQPRRSAQHRTPGPKRP